MADIELIIKIPEEVFKRTVFYREFRDLNDCVTTIKALEKAVPLSKGHGDLIDKKDLLKNAFIREDEEGDIFVKEYYCIEQRVFDDIPTIIKANKESKEVSE